MTLVGFKAQNHRQQTAKRGPNPKVDDRATSPEVFDPLHERFRFTIDVAASAQNAQLPRFYTVEDDGLAQSWSGERVWCNPPYSDIEPWVKKAWAAWNNNGDPHSGGGPELIVMLVPANRTEQGWWQDHIEPGRDQCRALTVEFLRGRLRFIEPGDDGVRPNARPPFGCCLLIWESI